MKIYCVKCREFTDTKTEKLVATSNGHNRMTGICKNCGSKKSTFVNESRNIHRKTDDELDEVRFKRASSNLKKRALKIGYKALIDKDTKKCVENCFPEHLRSKSRRKKEE